MYNFGPEKDSNIDESRMVIKKARLFVDEEQRKNIDLLKQQADELKRMNNENSDDEDDEGLVRNAKDGRKFQPKAHSERPPQKFKNSLPPEKIEIIGNPIDSDAFLFGDTI